MHSKFKFRWQLLAFLPITLLAALWLYFHVSTRPVFSHIEDQIHGDRQLLPAENIINDVLFNSQNRRSMQASDILARDAILDVMPSRNLETRLKQIYLGQELKFRFSETAIISTFLSNAFFGGQDIGLDQTARTLFNKDVHDLSEYEAAALAVLVQNPALRHNPDRWEIRTQHALRNIDLR